MPAGGTSGNVTSVQPTSSCSQTRGWDSGTTLLCTVEPHVRAVPAGQSIIYQLVVHRWLHNTALGPVTACAPNWCVALTLLQ